MYALKEMVYVFTKLFAKVGKELGDCLINRPWKVLRVEIGVSISKDFCILATWMRSRGVRFIAWCTNFLVGGNRMAYSGLHRFL